jgi:hypothetical protein
VRLVITTIVTKICDYDREGKDAFRADIFGS